MAERSAQDQRVVYLILTQHRAGEVGVQAGEPPFFSQTDSQRVGGQMFPDHFQKSTQLFP